MTTQVADEDLVAAMTEVALSADGTDGITDDKFLQGQRDGKVIPVSRTPKEIAAAGNTACAAKRIHGLRTVLSLISTRQDVLDVATAGGIERRTGEALALMRQLSDELEAILAAWEDA